jgi:single-strand DNA-binding protein
MLNNVVLIGRLTKDPEVRQTQSGLSVASFTLAVDRNLGGDKKETDFINIVVWRQAAEAVGKYLSKGKMAAVQGKIQTRNYEGSDGKKVYITEVLADNVRFLDRPDSKDTPIETGQDELPF